MSVQPLHRRERLYRRLCLREVRARERDEAVAAAEVVRREPVEHVRRAARREDVARSGDEVARGLGGPRSGEHRARAPDALHHLERVLRHDLEVLGRKFVDDLKPICDVFRYDAFQGLSRGVVLLSFLPVGLVFGLLTCGVLFLHQGR